MPQRSPPKKEEKEGKEGKEEKGREMYIISSGVSIDPLRRVVLGSNMCIRITPPSTPLNKSFKQYKLFIYVFDCRTLCIRRPHSMGTALCPTSLNPFHNGSRGTASSDTRGGKDMLVNYITCPINHYHK